MTDKERAALATARQNIEASESDFRGPKRLSDAMYNFHKSQLISSVEHTNTSTRALREAGVTVRFELVKDGLGVNVHVSPKKEG